MRIAQKSFVRWSALILTGLTFGCSQSSGPQNTGPNSSGSAQVIQPESYGCVQAKAMIDSQILQDQALAQNAYQQESYQSEAVLKEIIRSLNDKAVFRADLESLGQKLVESGAKDPVEKFRDQYARIHEKLITLFEEAMGAGVKGGSGKCTRAQDDTKVPIRGSKRLDPVLDLTVSCGSDSGSEFRIYFVAQDRDKKSPLIIVSKIVVQQSLVQKGDARYSLEVPVHVWYAVNSGSANGETSGKPNSYWLRNQKTQEVEFFWLEKADRKFRSALKSAVLPAGCSG